MTPLTTLLTVRAGIAVFRHDGRAYGREWDANAYSARVKIACAGDYFSHCSQYSPTSPAVRQCFRANGLKLSDRCVGAWLRPAKSRRRKWRAVRQRSKDCRLDYWRQRAPTRTSFATQLLPG